MELLQIPKLYIDKTGMEHPITAEPAKILVHHISQMTEGDWYLKWSQPERKISVKAKISALDDPLINEIFQQYRSEVSDHKELGVPILSQNPKDAICGFIYNNYSYPEDDSNIVIPPGFVLQPADPDSKSKLRRILRKIQNRMDENKTIKRDDMFIQYEKYLVSIGVDPESQEFADKVIEYWAELGRNRDPVTRIPPSLSKDIILSTSYKKYTPKSFRARYRYICERHPDFVIDWKMKNPTKDPELKEVKLEMVRDFDEGVLL